MWILAVITFVAGFIIGYALRARAKPSPRRLSPRELEQQIRRLGLSETSELVVRLEEALGVSACEEYDETKDEE